jgi:bifunctional UDP-N-acetylglucosamine pyrophosphorylase/glucosamine-1-phosphate N-acetyltransferase
MNHVIILAAGKGTRMKSELPKVLQPVSGVPMIRRGLAAAEPVCERPTIVVGHKAEDVVAYLGDAYRFAHQTEQRGTGHAVRCAVEAIGAELADDDSVFVMPGDHPLVTSRSLAKVIAARQENDAALALATVKLPDFEGDNALFSDFGRIVRDGEGRIVGIVEKKDATDEQKAITEVNVSYYCFRGSWLKANIAGLAADNAAGEYYLTDLVGAAFSQGQQIVGVTLDDHREGIGVNTPEQLLVAERG